MISRMVVSSVSRVVPAVPGRKDYKTTGLLDYETTFSELWGKLCGGG